MLRHHSCLFWLQQLELESFACNYKTNRLAVSHKVQDKHGAANDNNHMLNPITSHLVKFSFVSAWTSIRRQINLFTFTFQHELIDKRCQLTRWELADTYNVVVLWSSTKTVVFSSFSSFSSFSCNVGLSVVDESLHEN